MYSLSSLDGTWKPPSRTSDSPAVKVELTLALAGDRAVPADGLELDVTQTPHALHPTIRPQQTPHHIS